MSPWVRRPGGGKSGRPHLDSEISEGRPEQGQGNTYPIPAPLPVVTSRGRVTGEESQGREKDSFSGPETTSSVVSPACHCTR